MNNITQTLKVILLAIIISFGISYAFAWVAPTGIPTTGNIEAPLNTSIDLQKKTGNLWLNALGITNPDLGALIVNGGVGIGTTGIPSNKLTIDLGNANNNQGILAISSGTESALQLRNTATGGKEWQILSTGGTAGAGQGKLQFYNKTDAITGMMVTSAGNLTTSGTICDGMGKCVGGGGMGGTIAQTVVKGPPDSGTGYQTSTAQCPVGYVLSGLDCHGDLPLNNNPTTTSVTCTCQGQGYPYDEPCYVTAIAICLKLQ